MAMSISAYENINILHYLNHHQQETNLNLTFNNKLDLPVTVHDRSHIFSKSLFFVLCCFVLCLLL